MTSQRTLLLAALVVASGLVVGAMGSHVLRGALDSMQMHSLEIAVQYQLINGLGLFLIGLLARSSADSWLPQVALLLLAGILCFCGGIYLMLTGAPRLFGLVTPLGGVLMISAWGLLAWRLHKFS